MLMNRLKIENKHTQIFSLFSSMHVGITCKLTIRWMHIVKFLLLSFLIYEGVVLYHSRHDQVTTRHDPNSHNIMYGYTCLIITFDDLYITCRYKCINLFVLDKLIVILTINSEIQHCYPEINIFIYRLPWSDF